MHKIILILMLAYVSFMALIGTRQLTVLAETETQILAQADLSDGLLPGALAEGRALAAQDLQSAEFMFDVGIIAPKGMKVAERKGWIERGINFVFERIITIMAATVGSAAVLMMSIGGFMMLSSAGNQEQYDKGKTYIFKAMIGLVFVLGAYIMVTAVQLLIKGIYGT